MVENPYPIPRQLRQSDILVGDGGDTYGPFGFQIFDPADVVVCVRPAGALRFVEAPGVVVTKINGNTALNPLDGFRIKFPALLPNTTRYVVLSSRIAARAAGVMSGTRINPDALEKEFSKIATEQQELRRDINRAIMTDFGAPSFTLDADIPDGRTLMKQGDRLTAGPDIEAIGDAVEDAKNIVEGWVSDIVSSSEVPIVSTAVGLAGMMIKDGIIALQTRGFYAADGSGAAVYRLKGALEAIEPGDQISNGGLKRWGLANGQVSRPEMFGARRDGVSDDTSAILSASRALSILGTWLEFSAGTYNISGLLYPHRNGEKWIGAGDLRTIIRNVTNNEPLFCFGNPSTADGATQWASLEGVTFRGNPTGQTLWGVYCPNAALVDGVVNASGRAEGISNDPSNFYFGRTSFGMSEWSIAARGCSLRNVGVENVRGGWALHISAWGVLTEKVRLFSGKSGFRNSGAANDNIYKGFYISGMSEAGLTHPDTPSSIPTACIFDGLIVQQCGVDPLSPVPASVTLLKGQGTKISGFYLERNNEKGGVTDVYVGVSEIGLELQGVRHRTDTPIPLQTIVETRGQGTKIGTIVYASPLNEIVRVSGTDPRTHTVILSPLEGVGAPALTNGPVVDVSSGQRTTAILPALENWGFAISPVHKISRSENKLALQNLSSTASILALESTGIMRFSTEVNNVSSVGNFEWEHNGKDGAGTLLLRLAASNGALTPGANGTQNFGASTASWIAGYFNQIVLAGTGPRVLSNAGSPEGTVSAPQGSLCLNASGGPPYVKNSGTGNTGWTVMT